MSKKSQHKPAPKWAESAIKKEKHIRLAVRRKERILRAGVNKEELQKIAEQEKNRIIMCLLYGNYSVDLGTTRKVKKDKKEVEIPNVLRGRKAAVYTLGQHKVKVLAAKGNYVIVQSSEDNLEEDSKVLAPMGRIQVNTWEPAKKPTSNTKEVRQNAKKKRKDTNKAKAAARKGYAARKKSARFKAKGTHTPNNNYTLAQKRQDFAKKVLKDIDRKEKIKATEAKKAANNAKNRMKAIAKAKAKKEQTLKFAA